MAKGRGRVGKLDPAVAEAIQALDAIGIEPIHTLSIVEARRAAAGFISLQGEPQEVAEVYDVLVTGASGQLPARVYHPCPDRLLPVIAYFHGGGWVCGDLDVTDRPCRALANAAQAVVVAVLYRKSPETAFPGPLHDCHAAVGWIAANGDHIKADTHMLTVAGDSAGGNLAAGVTLMNRDHGSPLDIRFQVLIYPVTAPARNSEFPSYEANAEGYLLERATMEWFWDAYAQTRESATHPYAAPLLANDLSNLPPALIITCGFDVLRDEGQAYAQRLARAGVDVAHHEFADATHALAWLGGVTDLTQQMNDLIGRNILERFAVQP